MRWKWIIGIALVLAVVLTVTVYAILSGYDLNTFKPKIALAVKNATGRELSLEGDITLAIGLRPALVVENVAFQNASWGSRPRMAAIKRLQIQVALMPLLTGVIQVESLILIEPDILIETNKAGDSNLEFTHAQPTVTVKPGNRESREPGAVLSALLLDEVQIRNGRLAYKDGGSGKRYDMVLNQLSLFTETQQRIGVALEGHYNGEFCRVKGSIGRLPSLISASKAWPVTLTAQGASATMTVDGHIRDLFKFRGLALTVSGNGPSVPALLGFFDITDVPEVGSFEAEGRLADPEGRLAARDLHIVIGDETPAKITVTGVIEDLTALKGFNLMVQGRGRSVPDVVGLFAEADIPDLGAFTVKGNLTDRTGAPAVTGLSVELNKKDLARIRLSGAVKNIIMLEGMEIDFSAQGPELANLEQVTRRPLPVSGPFHMSGHILSPSKKAYTCPDLKVVLEHSDLAGSIALDLEGPTPRVAASLSSDKLDMRPYFTRPAKPSDKEEKQQPPEIKNRVFSDTPLPLDVLHHADADVKIRAKTALLPILALEDVTARVILKDGHLSIIPLNGRVGKGTFDGRMDLHSGAQGTKASLVLETSQLDLGRMLKDLDIEGVLEGKLDLKTDLVSHGNSVAELMAGLNGSTVVIMEQGKINEKLVGLLSGDPRGLFRLLSVSQKEAAYRDINCLVVGLDIDNGLAKTTALVLDTGAANILGRGQVDLASEKLDISLKPTPKTGVGIKGLGKFSMSLGELTKPLKIGGTLSSPNLAIDPSGTMMTLGKALGGAVLLGPIGLAAALAGATLGDTDPCPLAIEAARTAMAEKTGGSRQNGSKP